MTAMFKAVTKEYTLPLMRIPSISADERCFRKYVTDALGHVNGCYVERVLFDSRSDVLVVQ